MTPLASLLMLGLILTLLLLADRASTEKRDRRALYRRISRAELARDEALADVRRLERLLKEVLREEISS